MIPATRCSGVFGGHLAHHEGLSGPEPWADTVARLRCLRGIDTITAVGLVAEIGDTRTFAHRRLLTSYLGLVPSEQTSGTALPRVESGGGRGGRRRAVLRRARPSTDPRS